MGTIEARQLTQRKEAAARILVKYPDLCRKYIEEHCTSCRYFHSSEFEALKTEVGSPTLEGCELSLAPITSQQLPCPYWS